MRQLGTFNYFGKWKADDGSDSLKEFAKANIGKKLILTIEEPKKDRCYLKGKNEKTKK